MFNFENFKFQLARAGAQAVPTAELTDETRQTWLCPRCRPLTAKIAAPKKAEKAEKPADGAAAGAAGAAGASAALAGSSGAESDKLRLLASEVARDMRGLGGDELRCARCDRTRGGRPDDLERLLAYWVCSSTAHGALAHRAPSPRRALLSWCTVRGTGLLRLPLLRGVRHDHLALVVVRRRMVLLVRRRRVRGPLLRRVLARVRQQRGGGADDGAVRPMRAVGPPGVRPHDGRGLPRLLRGRARVSQP